MFKKKTTAYEFLKKNLSSGLKEVNGLVLEKAKSKVSLIPDVSKYITGSGGKRLRPLLTLASAEISGAINHDSVLLATSVEFIHTATLLHDDVIDQSELRRGEKTANNVWDNKTVILVGDFLFSQAFMMMVETKNVKALEVLSKASAEVIESEVYQLELLEKKSFSKEDYLHLIKGKTATLFAAAMESGAIVSTNDDDVIKNLSRYGLNLGMAFQIVDDYLDYFAGDRKFGKVAGNDFMEGKITLPVIYAIEQKKSLAKLFTKKERTKDDLKLFLESIDVESVSKRINEDLIFFSKEAEDCLKDFKSSKLKDCLIDLVKELNKRTL